MMNGLQNVEFELLREFIRICESLELTYYLVCGSALGAVKYGGFIPWDDDVDVALPRTDYEMFISQAQALLPDDIFVQNYRTDPYFPKIFTKLRRSDTTYIEKSSENLKINHGIFIDVFPLDGYPSDEREQKKLERLKRRYKLFLSCVFRYDYNLKAKTAFALLRLFGFHHRTQRYTEKLNALITSYSEKGSKLWCNHGNWQGRLDYAPREWFGDGAEAAFEELSVKVPAEYDAYLSRKYGDWRAELPKDEQKGHHDHTVCDPDRPYTMYLTDVSR